MFGWLLDLIKLINNQSSINSQYIPGDINLILTNPHGGDVIPDPDYMRDRRPGCYDEATGVCIYDSSMLDCESSVRPVNQRLCSILIKVSYISFLNPNEPLCLSSLFEMKGVCQTEVMYPDDGTQEITRQMADAAKEILGGRPHVVLLHLHRHGI